MVANPIHVLLIEDNPGDVHLIHEALLNAPTTAFSVEHVDRLKVGLERLAHSPVDVILLDLSLPDSHGLETLIHTCRYAPSIPVIVLTGLDDSVLEVRAVQAGAQDYLSKNALDDRLLVRTIRYAIERKRGEEALRESEAHLHLALWAANSGTWEWDLLTGENIWSEELWALYGLEPHSCPPSYEAWRQTIHPADRALVEQTVTTAAETGTELNAEWRVIDRAGAERWLMSRGQPLRDAGGQVVRYVGIVMDITNRARIAEQVQRYEFIANAATETMTLINRQHVFEAVNDAYCRAHGRSRVELIGHSLAEVWGEEHYRTNILPYLEQCFAGQIVRYEDSFTFEGDEPRYYQVGMYPYGISPRLDGPVTSVVVVTFDITDVKRAQQALRDLNAALEQRVQQRTRQLTDANLRLLELDQLKDQFISRISHELRTPLTSIKIYLEMLDAVKPEKRARYMQILTGETRRLQQLIESLLEVTQRSINTAGLNIIPTDLNRVAASLAADVAPRAANRGLSLQSTLTPDLPPVSADPLLLAQALSHLAANALNYTPTGGTIELSTAQVIDEGETWITFTIRDTGPGIAPDELPHIFDRFYRGRAAADYKTPGAGVGLSISRDILTDLSGRLTVHSNGGPDAPGAPHGATFTAWLKPAAGRVS